MVIGRSPRDPTEHSLAEIWEPILGLHSVDIDTSFFMLGGDLTLAATMLDRVNEMLHCRIKVDAFVLDPTIEGLAATVEEASDDRPAASPPGIYRDSTSFFFVSDRSARRLIRALATDRVCHLLPYMDEGRSSLGSIEASAACNISRLRALQRHGPYHLGGFSLGALVAFEMAVQLRTQGETVERLILVGPKPWSHRWLTWRRFERVARVLGLRGDLAKSVFGRLTDRVPHWEEQLRTRLRRPLREKIAGAIRRMRRALRSTTGRLRGGFGESHRPSLKPAVSAKVRARRTRHQVWRDAYQLVSRAYVPGPFPGRVTVLWAESDTWNGPMPPVEVWRKAGVQVDLRIVPGDHTTCLTRHVDVLAAQIRTLLDLRPHAQGRVDEPTPGLPEHGDGTVATVVRTKGAAAPRSADRVLRLPGETLPSD